MCNRNKLILMVIVLIFISCDENPLEYGDPPNINDPFDFRLVDFEPSWSPDGQSIAYVHGDTLDGLTGIYIIDTNGTNKRLLISSPSAYSPDWSPDGEWIAFSMSGQIYKIKSSGDSLTQLTYEGRNFFPSWSPDGQWIAFDSNFNDPVGANVIWKMHNDGNNKVDISEHGTGEWRMPHWSTDGEYIVHQRYVGVGAPEIVIMDINGNNPLRLTFDTNNDSFPKYSSQENKIVFTSQPNGKKPQILIMNSDGTNLIQLTETQGYSNDWSPNGSKIVYTDSRSNNGYLWIMNSDGSSKKQLTY